MKPNFKILLFSWLICSLKILFPCFLVAQKPPHLDSLIYLPENEPIEYLREDGIRAIDDSQGHWPDYGFESNPALPNHLNKEGIWRNAPIIVEGRTQRGTIRNVYDEYPAIIISGKEIYEVYPYALSYVHRGEVQGDTIYVLMPRYNYNKVQPPPAYNHGCHVDIFGPKYYSIAFIKPIVINGFTYYTPCNTDYQGFEWINGASKFYDNRCQTNYYTKKEIFEIFIQKGYLVETKIPTNVDNIPKDIEDIKQRPKSKPKKSDAIPVTGQKIEEYLRDKGWLRTATQNIKLRGADDFTYSIDDMEFYSSGMDQYDLEFKVYGSAEQNRNFGAALLFLEYNSYVFGDSIMTNSKLSVFKAPAFAGNSYSLLSNDDSDNVFGVSLVFTDFANSLGLLLPAGSKIHLYTVNITFSKTGCNNKPEFKPTEWDRVNFITHYMHPIDSSFTNYDTVTIDPIPNPTLCPFPQITTSFKNILGKRAGVGDTLVIKGHNFGQPGYVAFKDANFPPLVYTKGLESQYRLIWTDTLIKVLIPSKIKEGYLGSSSGCAGSGLVKVYTMSGDSAISKDTLKIEYANINVKGDNGKFYPTYLSKLYCINGFVFTLDSSLLGHHDIISGIEFCLKQWRDFTGLRLEIEKNSSGGIVFLKQESDATYRNFISFKHLVSPNIMVTSSPFLYGDINPDNIFVRNTITSIAINDTLNYWLVPTGDKPAGYYDFISTLLHELGHVLNIDHDVQYDNDLKSLMYLSSQKSFVSATDRENLNQWGTEAKNGVQYVIDQSKIQPLNDYASVKPLFSGNIPSLSTAPIINPSKDTVLCAESVSTYTLTSNNATNNRWNTGATTQSIHLVPPSFPTGQTELSRYYSVKQWNENCTLTSNPSLPVKVTWKKYCLKPPGDDKFTDEEINQRSYNQTNPILYPNPFSQGIQCEFEELVEGNLTVYISTINGNQVIKKEIQVKKGNLEYYIPLADLSSGIYFIIIKCGNKVSQQQMIKVE